MPRMDGTGPMGQGTNRNGNAQKLGVGYGKGFGNGNEKGMCNCNRCGQNFSSNLQPLAKDELTFLKTKANKIENNLTTIKNRISELEQDK